MKVLNIFLSIYLLFCLFANIGDAVQHPAVALFDGQSSKVLSYTKWQDIDFGKRSSISTGKQPSRVFALQATLPVEGSANSATADVKGKKDLFFIPFCSSIINNVETENIMDLCSLQEYEAYVLIRFRGGWEGEFSAYLWRDSTLNTNVKTAVHSFRAITNDSSITFPFQIDSLHDSQTNSMGFTRRYELSESCGDFTDECFQGRYMTYTKSFKEIPLEIFTGRIVFHVGLKGAWSGPWTLRLQSSMPHDSATDVDIILVLIDSQSSFNWNRWLSSNVLGNLVLISLSILWVMCFIIGVKDLGVRFSESIPLNERHDTILYDENISDDERCISLQRLMLAVIEIFKKIISKLLLIPHLIRYYLRSWPRRRGVEINLHNAIPDEDTSDGNINNNNNNNNNNNSGEANSGAREVEMQNLVEEEEEEEDENEDDILCRICRCKKPLDELFAPCSCDGSAKYVHTSCLEKWRIMTSNEEHRRVCAECKTPYVLVLARIPVAGDDFLSSPICVPACRSFVTHTSVVLFFIFQLWFGGYYLKVFIYFFTGLDDGIIWSAAHFYHWILGLYYICALCLNMCALEYVLKDFPETWQQLLLLLFSVGVIEIPLGYVGEIFFSWLLNRPWSLEVSYGLGIMVTAVLYVEMLPHVYENLQSFSTVREVVAPRVERRQNREVL